MGAEARVAAAMAVVETALATVGARAEAAAAAAMAAVAMAEVGMVGKK